MKAILIDPKLQQITEVDYDGNYKSIYKLIGADLFTVLNIDDKEAIFLDDEGLYREDQHYFEWEGYGQPLAGRGLILGTNEEGDSVATSLTVEEVTAKVTWRPGIEFHDMVTTEDPDFVHPIFGKMHKTEHRPIFRKKGE